MKKSILGYFLLFAIPALGTSTIFAQQSVIPSIMFLLNTGICSIIPSYYGERIEVCRQEPCASGQAPSGYGETCRAEARARPDGSFYTSVSSATSTAFSAHSSGSLCVTATDSYGEEIPDSYGEPIKLCDTIENVSLDTQEFGCGLGIDESGDIIELCDATTNPYLYPNPQFDATIRRLQVDTECTTESAGPGYQQSKRTCKLDCTTVGSDTKCDTATHYY